MVRLALVIDACGIATVFSGRPAYERRSDGGHHEEDHRKEERDTAVAKCVHHLMVEQATCPQQPITARA